MPSARRTSVSLLTVALTAASLTPVAAADRALPPPGFHHLTSAHYDGKRDDLLTAGLGFDGLRGPLPAPADPDRPTAAELRRQAIWASAGMSAGSGGGLGRLYGANVDRGRPLPGDGRIAGTEYRAVAGHGADSVSFVVQVPDSFDRARPCVVAAPATGLGGVYSMVGTAGAWGLHRRCAVAYTDKGMGPAFDDLHSDTVMAYDGTTGPRTELGRRSAFDAGLTDAERARFDAARPYRVAYKMAHSGTDPQATWGHDVLRSVRLALAVLNRDHRDRGGGYTAATTTVLATGVSNGGGAAVAAGEDDRTGLIDAVVASEPQMNLAPLNGIRVRQGGRAVPAAGLPLIRYNSLASLLQPCAALTEPSAPGYATLDVPAARRRCAALVGDDPRLIPRRDAERAGEDGLPRLAARALVRAGYQPQSGYLQLAHYDPQTPASYAMSYARASVDDALCGYGWARTDDSGAPAPYRRSELAAAFGTSPGRAPAPGVLIDENAPGGPVADGKSRGADGRHDYNLRGERCVYRLAFPRRGADKGRDWAARLAAGLDATRRSGDLHGKPAIVVHGRDDTRVPVNHSSRPYLGLNARAQQGNSTVSYVEVTHAHHSDAQTPGLDNRYVPLGYYYQQALDVMWQRLRGRGGELPPSQVVRTVPRGGEPGHAPELTPANVPPMKADPAPGDRVRVVRDAVRVP
ncbi:3-hydroxybutyrate oligomer hydrolase family protein [Streptomyces sp. NPDC021098]|uniref:3-hydroxybutyrate oligomer hydrolase family protein n=1 Tax=unclassified Streptomyces TaxID=2593676 RepID=UPI00378BCFEE